MAFEAGQEVWWIARGHKAAPRKVTVARVGRKNAYVSVYGRDVAFDKDTGYEVMYATSIGIADRLMTDEMIRDEDLRNALAKRLEDLGVRPLPHRGWTQPTGVLERLVAVLEEGDS